jgi:hypothetical protein
MAGGAGEVVAHLAGGGHPPPSRVLPRGVRPADQDWLRSCLLPVFQEIVVVPALVRSVIQVTRHAPHAPAVTSLGPGGFRVEASYRKPRA